MAPVIRAEHTITVKRIPTRGVRIGDIIVFRDGKRLVAHRLLMRLSLGGIGLVFQKGDAVGYGRWLPADRIVGVVMEARDADGAAVYSRRSAWNAMSGLAHRHLARALAFPVFRLAGILRRLTGKDGGSCRMKVGSTVMELRSGIPGLTARLDRYFRIRPRVEETPAVSITIGFSNPDPLTPVPDSLFVSKQVDRGSFTLGGGVLTGSYDREKGRADILVDPRLISGRLTRVFEQFLYQAFYSDPRNAGGTAFLMHASGLIHEGRGYVFSGPSGSGKSTIAGLFSGPVLNDEICLITMENGRAWVGYTPFNGFFRKKTVSRAPLEGVFFLSHARQHRAVRMDRAKASAALLQQIVPPIGIDEAMCGDTIRNILDIGERLQDAVAVYELAFAPNKGFIREVEAACEREKTGG